MWEQKQKEESSSNFEESDDEEEETIKERRSKYFEDYLQELPMLSPEEVRKLQELLNIHKIYRVPQFAQEISIRVQKISRSYQKFRVHYGYFQTELHIYRTVFSTLQHQRHKIGSGNFADVYYLNHKYAAKVFQIAINNKERFFIRYMNSVLREIFFLKIAGAIGVGPKIVNYYGFDVIFTQNNIQFVMEDCPSKLQKIIAHKIPHIVHSDQSMTCKKQMVQKFLENEQKKMYNDCLLNLRMLHSLKIVHRDIKTSNIGYNRILEKYVFLDFGFSKFCKEQIGQTSLTRFVGTANYCLEQLKKIFFLKGQALIDLYYNDLWGLKKSKQEFSILQDMNKNEFQGRQEKEEVQFYWRNLGELMKFIFFMQSGDFESARNIIENKEIQQVIKKVDRLIYGELSERNKVQYHKYFNDVDNRQNDRKAQNQRVLKSNELQNYELLIHYHHENLQVYLRSIEKIARNQALLKRLWKKQELMTRLFAYLFVNQDDQYSKKEVIKNLRHYFFPQQPKPSDNEQIRQILLFFSAYFYEINKIYEMKKISMCFLILLDIKNLRKNDERILQMQRRNSTFFYLIYLLEILLQVNFTKLFHFSQQQLFNMVNQVHIIPINESYESAKSQTIKLLILLIFQAMELDNFWTHIHVGNWKSQCQKCLRKLQVIETIFNITNNMPLLVQKKIFRKFRFSLATNFHADYDSGSIHQKIQTLYSQEIIVVYIYQRKFSQLQPLFKAYKQKVEILKLVDSLIAIQTLTNEKVCTRLIIQYLEQQHCWITQIITVFVIFDKENSIKSLKSRLQIFQKVERVIEQRWKNDKECSQYEIGCKNYFLKYIINLFFEQGLQKQDKTVQKVNNLNNVGEKIRSLTYYLCGKELEYYKNIDDKNEQEYYNWLFFQAMVVLFKTDISNEGYLQKIEHFYRMIIKQNERELNDDVPIVSYKHIQAYNKLLIRDSPLRTQVQNSILSIHQKQKKDQNFMFINIHGFQISAISSAYIKQNKQKQFIYFYIQLGQKNHLGMNFSRQKTMDYNFYQFFSKTSPQFIHQAKHYLLSEIKISMQFLKQSDFLSRILAYLYEKLPSSDLQTKRRFLRLISYGISCQFFIPAYRNQHLGLLYRDYGICWEFKSKRMSIFYDKKYAIYGKQSIRWMKKMKKIVLRIRNKKKREDFQKFGDKIGRKIQNFSQIIGKLSQLNN